MRQWLKVVLAGVAVGLLALSGCELFNGDQSPVARINASKTEGYAPMTVTLDASGSEDPDGDTLTYSWTLGSEGTENGEVVTHTFSAGTHAVTLRVTDPAGDTASSTITLTVHEVPNGYVVYEYSWTSPEGVDRMTEIPLPYALYMTYRGRIRNPLVDNYDYADYVLDPLDDPTLEDVAAVLQEYVSTDLAYAKEALAFVQGAIRYEVDPAGEEWPLYPLETLVDGSGDCEDSAILYVSLLCAVGIEPKLAFVDTDDDGTPDHVLALVPISSQSSLSGSCGSAAVTVFTLDGTMYAVAESTGRSGVVGLGCDPWALTTADIAETWSF